ncbi:MAG: 50S ribosomal protein L25 [Patescibacteria group bacterium]
MIILAAKIRKETGKSVQGLREKGILPAVLYGPKMESQHLGVDQKEFEKIYREAGESSLISLEIDGSENAKKKYLVLIHQMQFDPLTLKPLHVDFFQPSLKEEIEVKVPLIFEGEAPAVKELGGTLVKNISEIEVKSLPQNLPHEIRVDVTLLKTFENNVLVRDLVLPEGVKVLKGLDDIIAFVAPVEKVEEELAKPAEEKVEEVEKVEKEKKEEVELPEETKKEAKKETKQ